MKRFLANVLAVCAVLLVSGSLLVGGFFSKGVGWRPGAQGPVLAALAVITLGCVVGSVWSAGARGALQLGLGSLVSVGLVLALGAAVSVSATWVTMVDFAVVRAVGVWAELALQYLLASLALVACAVLGARVASTVRRPSNKGIERKASALD